MTARSLCTFEIVRAQESEESVVVSRSVDGDRYDVALFKCSTYSEARRAKKFLEMVPSFAVDV